ncbi:MAG: hypothetical protein IID44_28265 [Planctomycetes bacterium]|nr:hypothetical protein [Planctomycetota bacterium]
MAADEFSVDFNSKGQAASIKRNGKEVERSEDSQDYCDFLTWASRQPEEKTGMYSRGPKADFFIELSRLVECFKSRGALLWVDMPGGDHLNFGNTAYRTSVDGMGFIGLSVCVCETKHDDWSWSLPRALPRDGIVASKSDAYICVTDSLFHKVENELHDDTSDIRRLSNWPIERSFIYVDVSDFSTYPPGQQALIVNSIQRIVFTPEMWKFRLEVEASLCIGDGFIFVMRDAVRAAGFAAGLANRIEFMVAKNLVPVQFHFRMGAHVGEVYCFWDFGRNGWNFIGEGINGGNRVLSAIGKDADDVLFVSAEMRQKLVTAPYDNLNKDLVANLHNRGRRKDKHGKPWRVYEVNHTAAKWAEHPNVLLRPSDE